MSTQNGLTVCKHPNCKTEFGGYTDRDYCDKHSKGKYSDPFEDWEPNGGYIHGSGNNPKTRKKYYKRHNPNGKWPEMRKKTKDRDGHKCQECGLTDKQHRNSDEYFGLGLHVHHIVPVREFEDPADAHYLDNLITLCSKCHKKAEN